jgi:hypothetical protein
VQTTACSRFLRETTESAYRGTGGFGVITFLGGVGF